MLGQMFRKLRVFLKLERPGCQVVSEEVINYLDAAPNPGFMGQGPQEKDVGHSACRRAAQLGFYSDPNVNIGQVTQNPWSDDRGKIVDAVRAGSYARSKPTALGPEPGRDLRGNRIMPLPTEPEVFEAYLRDKLTPQLVIDNGVQLPIVRGLRPTPREPRLLDTTNRRRLNKEWLDWCVEEYGVNHSYAFEMAAKSVIDSEFEFGKMRQNVEILPWDPADPLQINIKYHDPVLEAKESKDE